MFDDDVLNQGILVVDDEEHIRSLCQEQLLDAGFKNIHFASNGLECINKLQESKENIVLIIMDIKLTSSRWDERCKDWAWNGLETIRHLTNIHHQVVGVLFHTAYDAYRDEAATIKSDKVLNLGYHTKSFDFKPFLDSVKRNMKLVVEKRRAVKTETFSYLFQKTDERNSGVLQKIETFISS